MENRTEPRQRVFKAGMIEFPGGAFSCVVRDLSPHGAKLDLPSVVGIPHEFALSIPSAQFVFSCRAVWRSERRMQLRYRESGGECSRNPCCCGDCGAARREALVQLAASLRQVRSASPE
ncbi:PilZ domain-containing protein [Bradyrhizobium manausense]|uniref:PilZ domain-containing protein n=1 Tax=Bradyrhizobium manausense TaxID=989370 RepID=UPI001BAA225F|nr:PilZ domain-containing protein [Bradyrhizobium manausense]MBR0724155.1 PilZ domain-containing protein [Bradyrhizobium manausense]